MAGETRRPEVVFDRRPGQPHRWILTGATFPAVLLGVSFYGLLLAAGTISLDREPTWAVIVLAGFACLPLLTVAHEILHWLPLRLAGYPARLRWWPPGCYVDGEVKIPRGLMLLTVALPFVVLTVVLIASGVWVLRWDHPFLTEPLTVSVLAAFAVHAWGAMQDGAEFALLLMQPRGSMVVNHRDYLAIFRP